MIALVAGRPEKTTSADRRSYKRRSAGMDVRFFAENMFYSGTILNLSENGMFIHTKICLPYNAILVVLLSSKNEDLQVVARVRRTMKGSHGSDGLGVELLTPPGNI